MGVVFYGILSYLVSFMIDFYHMALMTKDFMDQGYKIKYKQYYGNDNGNNNYLKYIPYFNLIPAIRSFINYKYNRDNIVRKSIFNGSAEVLTDKEKEQYAKKKSVFNAFRINSSSIMHERIAYDLAKEFDVPVEEAYIVKKEFVVDHDNIIYYQMDMLNSDKGFTITSSKGSIVNRLSRDEQLKLIYEYYDLLNEKIEEFINTYYAGNKEAFEEDIISNKVDIEPLKNELQKEYLEDKIIKKLK